MNRGTHEITNVLMNRRAYRNRDQQLNFKLRERIFPDIWRNAAHQNKIEMTLAQLLRKDCSIVIAEDSPKHAESVLTLCSANAKKVRQAIAPAADRKAAPRHLR